MTDDIFRVSLADALQLAEALDRNGGEEPLDLDRLLIDTSKAASCIRSMARELASLRPSELTRKT